MRATHPNKLSKSVVVCVERRCRRRLLHFVFSMSRRVASLVAERRTKEELEQGTAPRDEAGYDESKDRDFVVKETPTAEKKPIG